MGGSHSSSVTTCSKGSRSRSSSCSSTGSWRRHFFQAKNDVEESSSREPRYVSRQIWPSDEDRRRWVGEPDVDLKASAFIARFHQNRFLELESHDARLLQDVRSSEQQIQTLAA